MPEQLTLDAAEPARENPNAEWFNADGSPKHLLWCSDEVRIAWRKGIELPCFYSGERERFRPAECCKDIARRAA